MQDPLDFSPSEKNDDWSTWYTGYFCTKCKTYEISTSTPDLPAPRIADHIARCGISSFWWTDNPHPNLTKVFHTLTEVGKLAILVKLFKKLDETEMDFELSQQAIAELTNKLGSTMEVLETHQMRYKK